MRHSFHSSLLLAGFALSGLSACRDKPGPGLAPTASALQAAPAPASAVHFSVDPSSSKVTFLMDSPLEKIDGDASGALSGDLFVDPSNLSRSTGLVKVDLQKLVIYQQKRAPEEKGFTERKKNELQNQHARDWLQIVAHEGEVSAEQAEANRWAEFKVDRLQEPTLSDVSQASGGARTVQALATGEFRLHGRKLTKTAKLELTFSYSDTQPVSLQVKTLEPLRIGLEEFEVNPRDGAGKFVKSLSDALSSNLKGKVAQEAPLNLEFSARRQ